MDPITDKFAHTQRNRNEEQVVAAILHMSSPWGLLALVSSGVVWATYKSRSRFIGVQALQALLFQTISLLAFIFMFLIFMAGFYFAMFSGMIARTGVSEPELTKNLIVAMIVGFAILFFFEFIFPLWGIVAGIQILRGKNFQYPILGKLAIRWNSRQPFIVKSESAEQRLLASDNSHIIAGLGHLTIFAGLSLLLSPILWATNKFRSHFLSYNLLEASLFQISITILLASLYFIIWGFGVISGLMLGFSIPANIVV